jgi:hypothetical protein
MKNSQKKYLDKVVDIIVSETLIDYGLEIKHHPSFGVRPIHSSFYYPSLKFSNYCENTYGIVDQEIEYVWVQYTIIMKEKIK